MLTTARAERAYLPDMAAAAQAKQQASPEWPLFTGNIQRRRNPIKIKEPQ
jgi:hypothetical protein